MNVGAKRHVETVREVGSFAIPAGGFIERLELLPMGDDGKRALLPNMDASQPYRLEARLRGPGGVIVPLYLEVVWREVESDG